MTYHLRRPLRSIEDDLFVKIVNSKQIFDKKIINATHHDLFNQSARGILNNFDSVEYLPALLLMLLLSFFAIVNYDSKGISTGSYIRKKRALIAKINALYP